MPRTFGILGRDLFDITREPGIYFKDDEQMQPRVEASEGPITTRGILALVLDFLFTSKSETTRFIPTRHRAGYNYSFPENDPSCGALVRGQRPLN